MGKPKKKHPKKKRADEHAADAWPTGMIMDWCGTELFVVGWTENGFPYGVPAEELERDENETTFGALAECDVELFADDLERVLVGDVMSAIPRGDRDKRRDARASIRAAMDDISAALMSAFPPHDDVTNDRGARRWLRSVGHRSPTAPSPRRALTERRGWGEAKRWPRISTTDG